MMGTSLYRGLGLLCLLWLQVAACDIELPPPEKTEPRIDKKTAKAVPKITKSASSYKSLSYSSGTPIKEAPERALKEPATDGLAWFADSSHGLVAYDGQKFVLVKALRNVTHVAPGPNGSMVFSAKRDIYRYEPSKKLVTKLGSVGFDPAQVAATSGSIVFVIGDTKFSAFVGNTFKTMPDLLERATSYKQSFVDTKGRYWVLGTSSATRYDTKTGKWEKMSAPGVWSIYNFAALPGPKLWVRSHKGGHLLRPDKTWSTKKVLTSVALWDAVGKPTQVHLAGTTGVRVVDIHKGDLKSWKKGPDYKTFPSDMDADGRGRTWVVGSGGLAVLPDPEGAGTTKQFSVGQLQSRLKLKRRPWFRSVYVRGNGPPTLK